MDDTYVRALDEYNVICDYHRSEDQLKWQVLSLAYGAAAVLAGVAATNRYSYASVAIAAIGAAFTSLGTAVYFRIQRYTMWRLDRARELEESPLQFNHHRLITERYHDAKGKQRVNQVIHMGYWVPWVLWAGFLALSVVRHG
jgi:hypothetical protein